MLSTAAGKSQLLMKVQGGLTCWLELARTEFVKRSYVVCSSMRENTALSALQQPRMRRTPEGKEQKLAGKVAVVTGSTDGIGLAIAKRLCEEGASVMISSRHKANVDAALAQLRQQNLEAAGVVCHVGKEYDLHMLLEETVEEFGGIDILVSNAGLNPLDLRLLKTPEDTWNKILDINLKSSYFLCKEVVPHLEERGGGSIVLIGTTAAPCSYPPAGIPEFGSYNISNIALLAMMKTLNPELAPLNIRINCITPGGIRTRSWRDMFSEDRRNAGPVLQEIISSGRFGSREEFSRAVSFLVSDDASSMTGESIVVSSQMDTCM